jgi:hypothetical protein
MAYWVGISEGIGKCYEQCNYCDVVASLHDEYGAPLRVVCDSSLWKFSPVSDLILYHYQLEDSPQDSYIFTGATQPPDKLQSMLALPWGIRPTHITKCGAGSSLVQQSGNRMRILAGQSAILF